MNPYRSVLEDIDWLRNEWWLGYPDRLSEGHIRRGSSTLRLLLIDGLLQKAWLHHGFQRQPILKGPDIIAIAVHQGLRIDLAVALVAGGGRQKGMDLSFIGAFRVDNPTTGVPATAESGFAVCGTTIARRLIGNPKHSSLDAMVERPWYLSEYLDSPGAVRQGAIIKRREVIEYFRNYTGGVHHDLLKGKKHAVKECYELVKTLQGYVQADVREGLHFELLSIGQAVARSADVCALAEKIRSES